MIDLYMIGGEPLPFDMPRLYRLLHATSKEEQAAVQVVVEEFFRMDGEVLQHKRCNRELAYQKSMSEAARASVAYREMLRNQRFANDRSSIDHPSQIDRSSNQNQNQNQNQKKEKKTPSTAAFELPAWIPQTEWDGWIENRLKLKKPPTNRAKYLAVRQLQKLQDAGMAPAQILDQSTANGWAGLFPLGEQRARLPVSGQQLAELFPDEDES